MNLPSKEVLYYFEKLFNKIGQLRFDSPEQSNLREYDIAHRIFHHRTPRMMNEVTQLGKKIGYLQKSSVGWRCTRKGYNEAHVLYLLSREHIIDLNKSLLPSGTFKERVLHWYKQAELATQPTTTQPTTTQPTTTQPTTTQPTTTQPTTTQPTTTQPTTTQCIQKSYNSAEQQINTQITTNNYKILLNKANLQEPTISYISTPVKAKLQEPTISYISTPAKANLQEPTQTDVLLGDSAGKLSTYENFGDKSSNEKRLVASSDSKIWNIIYGVNYMEDLTRDLIILNIKNNNNILNILNINLNYIINNNIINLTRTRVERFSQSVSEIPESAKVFYLKNCQKLKSNQEKITHSDKTEEKIILQNQALNSLQNKFSPPAQEKYNASGPENSKAQNCEKLLQNPKLNTLRRKSKNSKNCEKLLQKQENLTQQVKIPEELNPKLKLTRLVEQKFQVAEILKQAKTQENIASPEQLKVLQLASIYDLQLAKYTGSNFKYTVSEQLVPGARKYNQFLRAVGQADSLSMKYEDYVHAQFYWFDKWFSRAPKPYELCSVTSKFNAVERAKAFEKEVQSGKAKADSNIVGKVIASPKASREVKFAHSDRTLYTFMKNYNATEEEILKTFALGPTGVMYFDPEWVRCKLDQLQKRSVQAA